ncbi:hypothetical protein [Methylobacterium oryzae]|uniref:hypothetical protein n=1 Tax=Methylobacterium TaxID=407 RepID=UPI00034661E6|nr:MULTISPECIES: hypothetical protein [Methylobacterium]UIN38284.1 hypothetical protein LXM90_31105 [Methylobacterium oryzae]
MASDTKNVKMGVCAVFFGDEDLGYTKGGVSVEVTTDTHEVEIDQFGKSPIDEVIMGRTVTAKVPLAETTIENMVKIMPGAVIVTDKDDPTKKKVVIPNGVGTSLLKIAKELRFHPKSNAATDTSDDFVIPLAATAGGLQFAYELENERIYNCTFKGYPDPKDGTLFYVGDDAVAGA